MNESTSHDLHILHGLIEAVEASTPALDGLIGASHASLVQARREAAAELQVEAQRLSTARADAGLLAIAQRVLGGLSGGAKPATHGFSDSTVEAQEADLQARFDAAFADSRLSGPVRDAVLRVYDSVKAGHDAARVAWLSARGEV